MASGKPVDPESSTRRIGAGGLPTLTPEPAPAPTPPVEELQPTPGAPIDLEVTLAHPATAAGEEPEEPTMARVRVRPKSGRSVRPQLDLCFVLDASASMHRFVLNPEQRLYWQQRAEQRGEITRQQADGRTGMVWTGQTLRELQQLVSTPMISALRGVWQTLEALADTDRVSVLGFADQWGVAYEDFGVQEKALRLETAKAGLARLGGGVDDSGLGRGTRLSGALMHAIERMSADTGAPVMRRLILVSDGIIEDAEECKGLINLAVDRGIVISVVGVGDEFDEEFLMPIADLARGNYSYAATAAEVEQAVQKEVREVTQAVGRTGVLRLQALNGTVIHDVYPISPTLSEFQAVWLENGTWRFRIGDLSALNELEFLVQVAPGAHPAGEVRLGLVRVEALNPAGTDQFAAQAPIRLFYTEDKVLLQARDDEVLDSARRLEIYLEERKATAAAARGDSEGATKHLKAATRMLKSMGADQLAEEMDAAAAEAETGTRDLSRTKRVKAGTRKLGSR